MINNPDSLTNLGRQRTRFRPKRLATCTLATFLLALSVLTALPGRSQAGCVNVDGIVDVGMVGDSCIVFNFTNNCNTPIDTIIIHFTGADHTIPRPFICDVTLDTEFTDALGIKHWSDDHFKTANWSWRAAGDDSIIWYANSAYGMIPPNKQGWLTICACCGWGHIGVPFKLSDKHTDTADHTELLPTVAGDLWSGPCDSSYFCDGECDALSVGIPYIEQPSNEKRFCVTVTRHAAGAIGGLKFYWTWPPKCHKDKLRLVSGPPGWHQGSSNTDSTSLVLDTITHAIPNCGSATFCFAFDSCNVSLCNTLTVGVQTNGYYFDTCRYVATVTGIGNPYIDNACCGPDGVQLHMTDPTQDPTTGAWSWCWSLHRNDNGRLDSIRFDWGVGECIKVTSIPYGWHYDSACGCYRLDTLQPNTGCRTYTWCFQTCDCFNPPYTDTVHMTGNAYILLPINFVGGIIGTCCGTDGWHNHDWITVKGVSPDCIDLMVHNTHYPCCPDTSFVFTLPAGCMISSVTLPGGWCWNMWGSNVHVFSCTPITPSTIVCCDSLLIRICAVGCDLGLSTWTTGWKTMDNCGFVDTGNVSFCGGCPAPKTNTGALQAPSGQQSSQNYPNPFGAGTNFTTTIPFATSATGKATIRIADEKGNVVLTEDEEVTYVGTHFFYFTANRLPAGRYYYQIEFPKGVVIVNRSMLLVK